jgi:threonine dehydrogenase-like Zn-dependent dehydrogenase
LGKEHKNKTKNNNKAFHKREVCGKATQIASRLATRIYNRLGLTMKAVTFQDTHTVAVLETPEPELQDSTDVVVRITRCAICGSDLHLYHGDIPMMPGDTCGHEFTGIVEDTGTDVGKFKRGDRVVGAFHTACGACKACQRGQYHLCSSAAVYGFGPIYGALNGTQAEYARVPNADLNLRHIPAGMDEESALFVGDILTTAYGAVCNAEVGAGSVVAIIGCGPVGIMAVQSALALGASQVYAIDLLEERLALAERLGAIPINASTSDPVGRLMAQTNGEGADAVIEAVGGPRTILLAFELVRPGGHIAAVGITAAQSFDYPLMQSTTKDITFRIGLANIHRDIDQTLALVQHGKIDPTVVISHRMALEDAAEGYSLFDRRLASKVILVP